MTAQSRSDELILALYNAWRLDAAIVALNTRVYDGPFVTDLAARYRLFVGATGLDEDEDAAVAGELISPHAANVARDETVRITCAAWFGDGNTKMPTARSNARSLMDAAVTYLRLDPGLGLANVQYGGMDSWSLRQVQSGEGATAVYIFVVRFVARIY